VVTAWNSAAGDLPLESVSYQYDATTGLPNTSTSTFNSRPISYAARTTYDALGRVSELLLYPGLFDAATGDNQCYQYDYLRRLTQAWTPGTDNCATAPSTAGLGLTSTDEDAMALADFSEGKGVPWMDWDDPGNPWKTLNEALNPESDVQIHFGH
jgi:hypothetical protein